MKHIFASAVLACIGATAALADPVEGTWQSPTNADGAAIQVKIAACGANICGTISKAIGGADTSIVGKRMIWDMKPGANGKYAGGRVWAPDDDKTYKGKLQMNGNTLKVSGCLGPICRGENFSRVN